MERISGIHKQNSFCLLLLKTWKKKQHALLIKMDQSNCWAVMIKEWHRWSEADLNEVYSLLQLGASSPEGPAAALVFRAADLIIKASIESNCTGWISGGNRFRVSRLSVRIFILLDIPHWVSTWSLRQSIPSLASFIKPHLWFRL